MLPDEAEHFHSQLNLELKKAKQTISIFTPYMNDYLSAITLKQMAKKGVIIKIITRKDSLSNDKISQLSLYENISIYALKTDFPLQGTLICIEGKELFILGNSLDYKALKQDYSFVLHTQENCEKVFSKLKERSLKKE